jgi:hypothetical protein
VQEATAAIAVRGERMEPMAALCPIRTAQAPVRGKALNRSTRMQSAHAGVDVRTAFSETQNRPHQDSSGLIEPQPMTCIVRTSGRHKAPKAAKKDGATVGAKAASQRAAAAGVKPCATSVRSLAFR